MSSMLAALEQVDQPAGRRDQHVDAAHQRVLLVGQALAADEQRVVELVVLAVLLEVLGDLQREFARRLEDQAARHARAGAAAGQDVDHRQGEAGGLAGAGLREAEHVADHQHDGNRLLPGSGSDGDSPSPRWRGGESSDRPRSWKVVRVTGADSGGLSAVIAASVTDAA